MNDTQAKRRSLEKRGLPLRMYAHGLGYRLHQFDGAKVNLGRDLGAALRRYYALTLDRPATDGARELTPDFIWRRHRKGAQQRRLTFTITPEYIAWLLEKQGHCCAVTLASFSAAKVAGMRIRPWLPSADRIDCSLGYVPGNVRIVCGFVNVAMNGFGEHFFTDVLRPLIDTEVQAELHRRRMTGSDRIPTVG